MNTLLCDLSVAEKYCEEKNESGLKERLKLGGKFLLDTAISIGCGLLANYLSRVLGI